MSIIIAMRNLFSISSYISFFPQVISNKRSNFHPLRESVLLTVTDFKGDHIYMAGLCDQHVNFHMLGDY